MAERDFQTLLDLISKTTTEIDRLEKKFNSLRQTVEKRIEAKDLGTDQISRLNAQLTTLLANITELKATQTSLLNQRAVAEDVRQLNSINKSIDTLLTKITELNQKRSAVTPGAFGSKTDIAYYDREIKRLESALASARSRAFNFSRAGNVPEERLAQYGTPQGGLPTRGLSLQTAKQAEQFVNQVQNSILKAYLDAVNKPVSAGLQSAANRYRQRLPRSNIFPELYPGPEGIGEGPDYIIRHPRRPTPQVPISDIPERASKAFWKAFGDLMIEAGRQEAKRIRAESIKAGLARQGGGGEGEYESGFTAFNSRITQRLREQAFKAGRLPTFEAQLQNKELGASDVSRANDRIKAEQERLLRSLRTRILSEERYAQALEQARRQGFDIDNLRRVQSRGTAGIEQLQFQRTDESGIQRRFDTYVNPSGRATPGISNQFRSFGQGVLRDIGELTKWSIALAAIYGPMRKLQELTQIMIENQTKLAEATVSVSSAFLDQQGIFDIAANSAEQAGESISGVIDAFTQAYRATGGSGDQVERLATAQNLLNDSLVLSKLSTLDQAQAIDTLSAALRQSSGDLNGGTEILDKWVRVTKVANVDLASLATGFAVLGDSAEAAGIDVDELNGLLAAIAETGIASGRELANSARRVVGFFQTDQAREALESIGVAFEDSAGKARPLLEVMGELSNLRETGILDDTTFSQLTQQIGQGVRGSATITTLIENFSRVGEVARESARASGDAQAALARQLETVQTSITRLGNAFQELAQSLGTEGGFLGIITQGVNGMTALVKVFDSLTSVLGKATPALAAFIATSLILKHQGRGGIQEALFGVGQGLERDPVAARYYTNPAQAPAHGRGRQALQTLTGTGPIAGALQGLVAAAIPALLNATNKEDRFGGTKAVANIIGGVGGGVVGSLVAGSPIIGAAIGTAISEAFVNSTIARRTDIFAYATGPQLTGQGRGETADNLDKALQDAEKRLYESIGFGSEGFGRFLTAPARTNEVMLERLNETIREGNKEEFEQRLNATQKELQNLGITPELARQAFGKGQEITVSQENIAYRRASEEARRAYDEALSSRLAQGDVQGQETAFTKMVAQNDKLYGTLLNSLKSSSQETLRQERVAGDVTGAAYGRRAGAISGFDVKALQYYTALGSEIDKITGGADDAQKAFEVLNNVITRGPEEGLQQLTSLTGEIGTLVNLLDNPALNKDRIAELFPETGIEGARQRLEELRGTLGSIITDINQEVLVGQIQIPQVQGDINKPLSQDDFNLVKQRAKELQDDFYKGFLQIPDDMYDALQGSFEEWAQIIEDSGKTFFETVSEIDPQFFQQAMQQLLEQNKLKSQKVDQFDIQQLDITSQQGAGLQGQINYFSRYLAQNFPQYEQKPEDIGVIFSDYVTSILHGDNLAIKLALDALNDKAQKQLDGMYNIPEGATFWVPLTAAYYRPKGGEGGLGLPEVGGEAANTSALQENTNALRELAFAFKGDLGYAPRNREGLPPVTPGFPGDRGYSRIAEANRQAALGFRGDIGESRQRALGGGSIPHPGPRDEGLLQTLQNFLRDLVRTLNPTPGRNVPGGWQTSRTGGREGGGFTSSVNAQQVNPVVNARLDMRIDNNTQLIVDGRVLASVITPYLASDLLRLEAAQGTITKRVII